MHHPDNPFYYGYHLPVVQNLRTWSSEWSTFSVRDNVTGQMFKRSEGLAIYLERANPNQRQLVKSYVTKHLETSEWFIAHYQAKLDIQLKSLNNNLDALALLKANATTTITKSERKASGLANAILYSPLTKAINSCRSQVKMLEAELIKAHEEHAQTVIDIKPWLAVFDKF